MSSVFDSVKQLAYERHYANVTVPRAERLKAALVRRLGRVDSLLDVGAGDGVIAKSVAEAVGATRVAGVDVVLRPKRVIDVAEYDGLHLPFGDRSFDAVTIVDVLHHCTDPLAVLRECVRVADKMVVVKDHFAYGPVSRKILFLMDVAGNARDSITSPGNYFEPHQWVDMVSAAGGRIASLEWPLKLHDLPWRVVVRPALHFAASILPVR